MQQCFKVQRFKKMVDQYYAPYLLTSLIDNINHIYLLLKLS